jgi:homoprotocatechuate degradation regulator HpaR
MSLLRAREVVVQQFRPMLRRHGLNEQQWRVLRVLAEHADITATELAQQAAMLSPSLSRMLPVMEARGLLRRKSGTRDQRHSLITMEPAGRNLFKAVSVDFELIYAQMAGDFGQERLERLHRELEQLRAVLAPRSRDASARKD